MIPVNIVLLFLFLLLSILPLCTFLLAPERAWRQADGQQWKQKKQQLPQNWGRSNGENKIQDTHTQNTAKWSYMPRMMTMNICKTTNIESNQYFKGKRGKLENAWFLDIFSFFKVQAFSYSNSSCCHLANVSYHDNETKHIASICSCKETTISQTIYLHNEVIFMPETETLLTSAL